MLITATIRTGNESAAQPRTDSSTGSPAGCGPCKMAQQTLGETPSKPFPIGLVGVAAFVGLLAVIGLSSAPKRR